MGCKLGYLFKKLNTLLALKYNSSKSEAIWHDYSWNYVSEHYTEHYAFISKLTHVTALELLKFLKFLALEVS